MLLNHPRFCVGGDGKVFCSLSSEPSDWGFVSVVETDLVTWQLGGRYAWLDWPRPLLQILFGEPSRAAVEIAEALLHRRQGHA